MPSEDRLKARPDPEPNEAAGLRLLSRSPKPYHHQSFELLDPADCISYNAHPGSRPAHLSRLAPGVNLPRDSPLVSDSGTEADDEHYLKGLPAPKVRLHKGLRGRNEVLSGSSSPMLSPTIPGHHVAELGERPPASVEIERRHNADRARQARLAIRRYVEVALVAGLVLTVISHRQVEPIVRLWFPECLVSLLLIAGLVAAYPLRVILWAKLHTDASKRLPLRMPTHFDPAPILYPQSITVLTTLLISPDNPRLLLPNLILCLCSLPEQLIPSATVKTPFNDVHWLLSCVPLFWATARHAPYLKYEETAWSLLTSSYVTPELAVLLYPLHRSVRQVIHYLTTTSLLPAELELLSISLINLLLLSSSPQMRFLKALLWVGGLSILVICGPVITWGIALARVPKWRFRRERGRPPLYFVYKLMRRFQAWTRQLTGRPDDTRPRPANFTHAWSSSDDADDCQITRQLSLVSPRPSEDGVAGADNFTAQRGADGVGTVEPSDGAAALGRSRTFPVANSSKQKRLQTRTATGRKRRSMSSALRALCTLTQTQAAARRWMYAAYVYLALAGIILGNVRAYITQYALEGSEAIGWALSYFLGDIAWFRLKVLGQHLDHWIALPPLRDELKPVCHEGWVQHLRLSTFGAANTRLLISGYWILVIAFGLVVVYRLKDIYEVDTRRKIFHFMMVAMFLPATYIDPAFAALALATVLAIFLILDLLRASQLPPLSKPIASFLAPYVDGRDFRGPVVISHIFLLVGCAIPLWLTLASLPRTGGSLAGWEVPTREVSMISGVVCVGLGDAAASLIGRRWGHRKWVWGGGKSLEGSAAFAVAVFVGLVAGSLWLRIGGWPITGGTPGIWRGLGREIRGAGVCASVASLTEAVLTGGNDNVVVPVVVWTCVKSFGA